MSADIAAEGSGNFELIVGGQKISGAAPVTQDYTKFQHVNLDGTLDLPAGSATLTVKPVSAGWQPMNLRSVLLTPAE